MLDTRRLSCAEPHSCKGSVEHTFNFILGQEEVQNLYYDFRYITDELVYYGLRTNAGQSFESLASMLFTAVFNHPMFLLFGNTAEKRRRNALFPSILLKWEGQQRYFAAFDVCFHVWSSGKLHER